MVTLARLVPFMLAAIGVSSSFIPAWAGDQPTRGGELIVAIGNDISTVNPAITPDLQGVMVGCGIYQGLVNVSSKFEVTPLLAKEWAISPDGLTYSFKLRSANWSDGKHFTSASVVSPLTMHAFAKHWQWRQTETSC